MRPHEICQKLLEDMTCLDEHGEACSEEQKRQDLLVSEDVRKRLDAILEALQPISPEPGGPAADAAEEEVGDLLSLLLDADIPARLIAHLDLFEFEVRKEVITVWCALLQHSVPGTGKQMAEYVRTNPGLLQLLLEGYQKPEVALHCGMMLRSCARHPELVQAFWESGEVLNLVHYALRSSFEVSSDAFSSLHDLLLMHKPVSSAWLQGHFTEFFGAYNALLQSEDYATQRQALRLLSMVLLDKAFMPVMKKYVCDDLYLQLHMNFLRDSSMAIKLDAFRIFKVFAANPSKPPRVAGILHRNRDRILELLETLVPNGHEEQQFNEDRKAVVKKLRALEPPPRPASPKKPGQSSNVRLGLLPTTSAEGGERLQEMVI